MQFLIFIAIVYFCYYANKNDSKKSATIDNSIMVICPHCKERVSISKEGEWVCPHCHKDFTYYEKVNQTSSNTSYNNNDNLIRVNCPYCNDNLTIESEGQWNCPNCKESFIYRNNKAYKFDDVCNEHITSIVTIFAKISKADGVVTQKEISMLDNFLTNEMELTHNQKKEAANIFNTEKQNYYNYEMSLRNLSRLFSNDKQILKSLLEEMFKLSHEDGGVHIEQEKIIQKAIQIFGLSTYDYEEIKNKYIEDLDKYYAVLNCTRHSSVEEIKSNYKKLMLTYHPDKYLSKDLPEEMLNLAKEKTQAILEAYKKISKARNF